MTINAFPQQLFSFLIKCKLKSFSKDTTRWGQKGWCWWIYWSCIAHTPLCKVLSSEVLAMSRTLDLNGLRSFSVGRAAFFAECSGRREMRGITRKMGSDSMSTYSNKCIKISLKACQNTYHLSLWPSICSPIHLSAQVGCLSRHLFRHALKFYHLHGINGFEENYLSWLELEAAGDSLIIPAFSALFVFPPL